VFVSAGFGIISAGIVNRRGWRVTRLPRVCFSRLWHYFSRHRQSTRVERRQTHPERSPEGLLTHRGVNHSGVLSRMMRSEGWSRCKEPPSPGPGRDDQGVSSASCYNPHRPSAGRRVEAIQATLERAASHGCFGELLTGLFEWMSVPRSIGVGSWSGDTSMRALMKVC